MANVHLIWWGSFRDYATCLETANDIASSCPGHSVHLWIRSEALQAFRAARPHPALEIKALRSFIQLAGSQSDVLDKPFFKQTVEVLQVLDRHRCFAAVKDLMNLLLMYVHGGLCVDTTAKILPPQHMGPSGGRRLVDALKDLPGDFRIPKIAPETWNHQPGMMTTRAILFGRDYEFDGAEDTLIDVPAIDVWTMWAPARLESVATMLASYLSRADRIGVNRTGFGTNVSKLGDIEGADLGMLLLKDPSYRMERNQLIGKLIVGSVYDGMCVHYKDFNSLVWDTEVVKLNTHYRLPSMGLQKIYKNSWR